MRFSSLCVPLNVVKTYLGKIDEKLTGDDEQVIGDGADNQSIIGSLVVLICSATMLSGHVTFSQSSLTHQWHFGLDRK